MITTDNSDQHRPELTLNQQNAHLRLSITLIGEALTELGNMLCAGGVKESNHYKRGVIAVALERAAFMVRGQPHDSLDMLVDITAFHDKFKQRYEGPPRMMKGELLDFRLLFLREEINELEAAHDAGNLEKAFDALIDTAYVLFGTVHLMGMSDIFAEGWRRVQAANMSKRLASSAAESAESTGRGYALDVVKPEGWKPPTHTDLLEMKK